MENLVKLVDIVTALEEGPATQQLGQNATHGPNIDWELISYSAGVWGVSGTHTGFRVALEAQHDFRRTVPSCGDIFRHVSCILLRVDGETTGQTEIANLQLAIRVDEKVSGLQITVQNVGRMDVFETAEDLVNEGLEMGVGEGLSGANDSGQIALHQF